MPSIRYQVMAMEDELNGPMTVTAVSWMRSYEGDDRATEYELFLYMGICEENDLVSEFDQNYSPGSRELVFYADSLSLHGQSREWLTIPLEQPFEYSGSGNLVIELTRSNASYANLFCFRWYTDEVRTVFALKPAAPFGYADSVAAMLRIDYISTSQSRLTWSGIKSLYLIR